jgi:hypothetical protein
MSDYPAHCGHCGFKLQGKTPYCGNCGARLGEELPEEEEEEESEELCDEEASVELYRREEAEYASRILPTLPLPSLGVLAPEDRNSLRWRWFKSMAAAALQAILCLGVAALIIAMLTSPMVKGSNLAAFIIFSLGLAFFGIVCGRGLAANLRVMGRLSQDLAEDRKEVGEGYLISTWQHISQSRQRRRAARSLIVTPWSRRFTRYMSAHK